MASMEKLQQAYKELMDKKAERKEIAKSFKDDLENNARYREINEQMKALREEKKMIENEIYASSMADVQKMEDLKQDVKTHEMLVSDLAVNLMMNNESVEVTDEYNNKYEASFNVRFKKTGDVAEEKAKVAEAAQALEASPALNPNLAAS